jgi:signal transduction histidine kinase
MTAVVRKSLAIFVFVAGCCIQLTKAQTTDPLNNSFHREILDNYKRKSDEYVARNLNRFAIDRLQVYDRLLDTLFLKEKNDTLASIEHNYDSIASSRIKAIAGLRQEIKELTSDKVKLETRYWSLVRYAIISFLIWLAIVLIFFRIRQSRMKKSETAFYSSATQLESLEASSAKAGKLFSGLSTKEQELKKMDQEIINLEKIIEQKKDSPQNENWTAAVARTEKLRKALDAEKRILHSVLEQSISDTSEKTSVDINNLCDAYMEIAYRGIEKSDTFKVQVTRDFEKKLPQIKVNSSAVGTLLLNVLSNAFQSVKDKSAQGIKGYEPKVSISTRILPRFLQIRVRDNGLGMNEQLLQASADEFYSTRPVNEGTGLGLSIAKNIIAEHKGEIKIESEQGNSTDVYIKFFI